MRESSYYFLDFTFALLSSHALKFLSHITVVINSHALPLVEFKLNLMVDS